MFPYEVEDDKRISVRFENVCVYFKINLPLKPFIISKSHICLRKLLIKKWTYASLIFFILNTNYLAISRRASRAQARPLKSSSKLFFVRKCLFIFVFKEITRRTSHKIAKIASFNLIEVGKLRGRNSASTFDLIKDLKSFLRLRRSPMKLKSLISNNLTHIHILYCFKQRSDLANLYIYHYYQTHKAFV